MCMLSDDRVVTLFCDIFRHVVICLHWRTTTELAEASLFQYKSTSLFITPSSGASTVLMLGMNFERSKKSAYVYLASGNWHVAYCSNFLLIRLQPLLNHQISHVGNSWLFYLTLVEVEFEIPPGRSLNNFSHYPVVFLWRLFCDQDVVHDNACAINNIFKHFVHDSLVYFLSRLYAKREAQRPVSPDWRVESRKYT